MANVKIISVSLTQDSIDRLDRAAQTAGRSRSMALERIIMATSEKTLARNAKRNPVYAERAIDGEQAGISETQTRG